MKAARQASPPYQKRRRIQACTHTHTKSKTQNQIFERRAEKWAVFVKKKLVFAAAPPPPSDREKAQATRNPPTQKGQEPSTRSSIHLQNRPAKTHKTLLSSRQRTLTLRRGMTAVKHHHRHRKLLPPPPPCPIFNSSSGPLPHHLLKPTEG